MMITLSKYFLLITNEFFIKFRNFLWFRNFEILFASRVMSYESFFEKSRYDSNMTHNIYNIHIIWLQILFLIQCCKNFWDSPTQNFQMIFSPKCVGGIKISTSNSNSALNSASDSIWRYMVYIRFVSVFTEYSVLRLRNHYLHANRR